MKFDEDKDTDDYDLDGIHRTVLNSVKSNIAEFVQMNKYGAINVDSSNADNFYVVPFTPMPYTLQ
eukprot:11266213-Ditylum_brightwellii.AAC.1